MKIEVNIERLPFETPFAISGYVFDSADVIVVSVIADGLCGRGEAFGVYYHGETAATMAAQVSGLAASRPDGFDRAMLQRLLPPGGARNAIDCALWDIEAKRRGTPVWRLAGLPEPLPLRTTMTLGVDEPDAMAIAASGFADARSIKVKLSGDGRDADRIRAIRAARPEVWLGIDANQGFDPAALRALMPVLMDANVSLIEQPFAIGRDADLDDVRSPILVAADESVQSEADVGRLVGRFDMVNVKLDKCGGLTGAIAMVAEARRHRLRVMVGCMPGTVMAVAPAWMIAQICDYGDLDAPIGLRGDREPPALFRSGSVSCPAEAWGHP